MPRLIADLRASRAEVKRLRGEVQARGYGMSPMDRTDEDRSAKGEGDGCWVWTANRDRVRGELLAYPLSCP